MLKNFHLQNRLSFHCLSLCPHVHEDIKLTLEISLVSLESLLRLGFSHPQIKFVIKIHHLKSEGK